MPSTTDITLELVQASPDQIELVRNLYQFYAYESSDWEQEDVELDGRFYIHDEHLQRYWQEPQWSANLLLVDGFIAGFLLIERSDLPGIDALELALRIKPSVLENRRLRWPKHMWLVHNVLGHPLMHVLALLRCYKAAFWVHDATVPKPSGQHRRFVAGNSP